MLKLATTGLLASLLLVPAACGQPAAPVGGGQPVLAAVQAQPPQYESLAVAGPDGKIVRVEGIIDLLALRKNPLVDEATLQRIRPLIKEWMQEVDQIAIDNLDFILSIEPLDGGPGMIEEIDITKTDKITTLGQMTTHLISAGPLSVFLENKGGLTREQSQLTQTINNDYLQKVMNEILAENDVPNDFGQPAQNEEEKTRRVNVVTRFVCELSTRDAVQSYRRILVQTAPNVEQALAAVGVSTEVVQKARPAVAKAKAAATDEEKRAAMREVLKALSFDQQRALLEKGRELAGDFDPLAVQTAAAKPAPGATAAR